MFGKKGVVALRSRGVDYWRCLPLGRVRQYKSDVTVQALGSFVKNTTDNGVTHSATNSGGVLGTYRYYFGRHNGVEFNYGYTLNSQQYALDGNVSSTKAYSHEATAAYVWRLPLRRVTPFALAGTGSLIFDPKDIGGDRAGSSSVRLWRRCGFRSRQPLVPAGAISRAGLQQSDAGSVDGERGAADASRRTVGWIRIPVLIRPADSLRSWFGARQFLPNRDRQ